MKIRTILIIIFLTVLCIASSREIFSGNGASRHLDLKIAMNDGVLLSTEVFLPRTRKKVPAILVRTPYNKAVDAWLGKAFGFFKIAVVVQDVRGKYGSEGVFYPFLNEREDGLKTLEWIRQQPWSNGVVGGWGASYLGYTQLAISDSLDFLLPLITGANLYDFVYPEGVFSLQSALGWSVLNSTRSENKIPENKIKEGMHILPLSEADDSTIYDVDFFNDWLVHEVEDQYWDKLNHRGITKAPVLSIAGWYDIFLKAQIDDFQALEAEGSPANRMIIGPWCHGAQAYENDYGGLKKTGNPRKAFMYAVRSVKGKRARLSSPFVKNARYNLFIMELNEYVGSDTWPPGETRMVSYYLGPDKYLDTGNYEEEGFLTYQYDPSDPYPGLGGTTLGDNVGPAIQNSNTGRDDQLTFETGVFDEPVILLGNISASLWVSSDVSCTGFVVSLQDVFPDGTIINIQEGALNVRFGDGIKKIDIPVWATGYQLGEGHRMRVVITSSWFPRFNRSLNNCEPIMNAENYSIATQKVYFGEETPSRIDIPVYSMSGI